MCCILTCYFKKISDENQHFGLVRTVLYHTKHGRHDETGETKRREDETEKRGRTTKVFDVQVHSGHDNGCIEIEKVRSCYKQYKVINQNLKEYYEIFSSSHLNRILC